MLDAAKRPAASLLGCEFERGLDPVARCALPDVDLEDARQGRDQRVLRFFRAEKAADDARLCAAAAVADPGEASVDGGLDEIVRRHGGKAGLARQRMPVVARQEDDLARPNLDRLRPSSSARTSLPSMT